MASSKDFAEYVCDQIGEAGDIGTFSHTQKKEPALYQGGFFHNYGAWTASACRHVIKLKNLGGNRMVSGKTEMITSSAPSSF